MNYTKLRGNQNPKLVEFCFSNWLNFNGSINNQYTDLIKLIAESGNSNISQKYAEFKRLKNELSSLYQSKSTPIINIKIEYLEDSLLLIDQQLNEFYSLNNKNQIYSTMDIKNVLKEDEAYIEIVKVPTFDFLKGKITDSINYYVFIIQKDINNPLKQLFIENGNDLEDELIKEYSKNTIGTTIENSDLDVISYNAFWKPIADQIKDKKKIYVSMGGVYNSINIQTLYNTETNSYLLDEKDIQIVNSGKSFIQSKTNPGTIYSNNTAILMGFPNYNDSITSTTFSDLVAYSRDLKPEFADSISRGGFSLTNLPGTKKEVEAIGKSMSINKWDVSVLMANQATETILKNSNSPRVLHIATHGYFMNNLLFVDDTDLRLMGMNMEKVMENPLLQSGLFFAGANQTLKGKAIDKKDNGILTAYEASMLDLKETELVVLSACETGRGEVKNGEGVYGLRKAFVDAGAKNVIMSLWKVDDKVTQEFMTSFYKNWLDDISTIREAFNKTQLEIKAKYPQPYYWGAFILVGE
jgi:CHAT domain-containing protein